MRALLLAVGQLDDPAFLGVLVRSVALALLAYVLLLAGAVWLSHALLAAVSLPGWLAVLVGTLGVGFAAVLLFLPTVVVIATLYLDRIAVAVDRRYYPMLPQPSPAPLAAQLWDGLMLAAQVLLLNVVALVLALLPIPGLGLLLAVLVSGWAIGRGLFVAVAMRRMGLADAQRLYRRCRWAVVMPGIVLASAAYVPLLNLLVPIVGTAVMVHVLNEAIG